MGAFSLGGGKSKGSSSSSSGNVNNGQLSSSLMPAVGATGQATNLMGTMLNGGPQGFANSGGFDFLMKQGTEGVNSNMASRGLLNSGADMKGLEDYRSGQASTFLNNYMNQVNNMGQLGLGAGSVLANSGDVSSSKSKNKSKNGSVGVG
jgi:hypothetical protein